MELVLSPVYYAWDRQKLKDFYLHEVVNMDLSVVYIGEVICQKRATLSESDYIEIISALKASGKKVYLSTLALITNNDELDKTLHFARLFDGVEVNSFGVLNLVIKDEIMKGKDIVIGPFMNIYNSDAASYLRKFNPVSIVTPYEVPYETIKDIAENASIPVEVYGWGHLSTALSWRCYTARTFEHERDNCHRQCFEYPDGILLKTVKEEDVYIINGIQLLSSKVHCIVEQLDMLKDAGVEYLRITPSSENTSDVVNIFSGVLNGNIDAKDAVNMLGVYAPLGLSNGWFLGKPGWQYVAA